MGRLRVPRWRKDLDPGRALRAQRGRARPGQVLLRDRYRVRLRNRGRRRSGGGGLQAEPLAARPPRPERRPHRPLGRHSDRRRPHQRVAAPAAAFFDRGDVLREAPSLRASSRPIPCPNPPPMRRLSARLVLVVLLAGSLGFVRYVSRSDRYPMRDVVVPVSGKQYRVHDAKGFTAFIVFGPDREAWQREARGLTPYVARRAGGTGDTAAFALAIRPGFATSLPTQRSGVVPLRPAGGGVADGGRGPRAPQAHPGSLARPPRPARARAGRHWAGPSSRASSPPGLMAPSAIHILSPTRSPRSAPPPQAPPSSCKRAPR